MSNRDLMWEKLVGHRRGCYGVMGKFDVLLASIE